MKCNFEKFCKDYENIENYERAKKDNFKGWECHHRLETHTSDGIRRPVDITVAELKALGMYYNRPAEELIFLTTREHHAFKKGENHPMYGKRHTEETRRKMREAQKGEKHPFYGKHHSEESKEKMREAKKGKKLSEETKKKMAESKKGENHPMYGKHHSEESKKKMAESKKGTHWYNNGKINIMAKECPEGFVPGKLR